MPDIPVDVVRPLLVPSPATVVNIGSTNLWYKSVSAVSAALHDGTLASNGTLQLSQPTWFLSEGPGGDLELREAAAAAAETAVAPVLEREEQSASFTLKAAQAGKRIVCTKAGTPQEVTIPTNATEAIAVGTVYEMVQKGTGQLTIIGAAGVTVTNSSSNKARTQGSNISLVKEAANEWALAGDLE